MLRRLLAAAFLVLLAAVLLVFAWPQLFGLEHLFVIAQAVSLRGAAVAASVILIVILGLVIVLVPVARRFAASIAVLLVVFSLLNLAVLSTRGLGSLAFETANESTVTVLSWNTLGDAPGAAAIADLALENDAEIVTLPETTRETADLIAGIMDAAGKPMQVWTVAYDQVSKARSTSLLVSANLGEYRIVETKGNSAVLPSVFVEPVDGSGPTIASIHLVAPIPGEMDNWRSDLDWVASACNEKNLIMAGDFNSTLDHFDGLGTSGDAVLGSCLDAADASGNAAVGTWPTALPALLASPIDHVLQTPNWRVSGMRVIENVDKAGSDHRPVLAELMPAN